MNAIERLCSRALWIDKGGSKWKVRMFVPSSVLISPRRRARSLTRGVAQSRRRVHNSVSAQRFFLADGRAPVADAGTSRRRDLLHLVADFKALDPGLVIGYSLYAESGELLYRSSRPTRNRRLATITSGQTILRGRIPSGLLNEGTYRLDLIAASKSRVDLRPSPPLVCFPGPARGLERFPAAQQKAPRFSCTGLRWESCATK